MIFHSCLHPFRIGANFRGKTNTASLGAGHRREVPVNSKWIRRELDIETMWIEERSKWSRSEDLILVGWRLNWLCGKFEWPLSVFRVTFTLTLSAINLSLLLVVYRPSFWPVPICVMENYPSIEPLGMWQRTRTDKRRANVFYLSHGWLESIWSPFLVGKAHLGTYSYINCREQEWYILVEFCAQPVLPDKVF